MGPDYIFGAGVYTQAMLAFLKGPSMGISGNGTFLHIFLYLSLKITYFHR